MFYSSDFYDNENIVFDELNGWQEKELTNNEIINLLEKQKDRPFLSFSYGVWITAYARNNLLQNLLKQDKISEAWRHYFLYQSPHLLFSP